MLHTTSVFLDVLRFTAACIVLLSHSTSTEFNRVLPWVHWGHEAVVAFFVLSGFVIAFVIDTKEHTLTEYASARFGRLYSVVLPALAFTLILDTAGRSLSPEVYHGVAQDHPGMRLLVNLVFLEQNWNLTVNPLSNGAFWSLGFEFWYYVMYGIYALVKGPLRIVLLAVAALIAGPRILAFLPLWLLGVVTFHIYQNWRPSVRYSRVGFFVVLVAVVNVMAFGNPLNWLTKDIGALFKDNYFQLAGLRIFLGDIPRAVEDLFFGVLICAMILFSCVSLEADDNSPWVKTVRYLAGSTFTIYLFHAPLLYFFSALGHLDKSSKFQVVTMSLVTLATCMLLSYVGERQVFRYKSFFRKTFVAIQNRLSHR